MDRPSQGSCDSDGLLASARAGDQEAFGQLATQYGPYLKKVAARVLGSRLPGDASSVVQEALIAGMEHLHEFRNTQARAFLAYLAVTVRNKALNRLKRVRREQPLPEGESNEELLRADDPSPSEVTMAREEAARLREVMERLPHDYREVIDLRDFEHRSYSEIASHMGRSEDAVRQLWVRAIKSLRELWSESDER